MSRRPHRSLDEHLQRFLSKYDTRETLLIIYYGGHAKNNQDKHHIRLCHNPRTTKDAENPKVNWSRLQGLFLDECQSDVLFILDCCYSASAAEYTHATSTVEAIVATGFEGAAPLRGADSFTCFLAKVLGELREKQTAVFADALCRMVSAKLNRTDLREAVDTSRSTPRHIPFANKHERIIIGELRDADELPRIVMVADIDPDKNETRPGIASSGDVPVHATKNAGSSKDDRKFESDKQSETPSKTPKQGTAPSTWQADPSGTPPDARPEVKGRGRAPEPSIPPPLRRDGGEPTEASRQGAQTSPNPRPKDPDTIFVSLRAEDTESSNWFRSPQGCRDCPGDFRLTTPDYAAVEERIELDPEVPCRAPYTTIRTGQIRTLHIFSSEDVTEPIIAHLVTENFIPWGGQAVYPDYVAISFCWGDGKNPAKIYIIDKALQSSTAISVPKTLECALRYIRDAKGKAVVWVDMVCIRQDRASEEWEHHAPLLSDIFNNASSVIAVL